MARGKPIIFGGRWMDELRTGGRFLRGLRPFLKHPLDLAGARRLLDRQLAAREQTFAGILERGVFENPGSPYHRLFEWAGVGLGDVSTMLASDGKLWLDNENGLFKSQCDARIDSVSREEICRSPRTR